LDLSPNHFQPAKVASAPPFTHITFSKGSNVESMRTWDDEMTLLLINMPSGEMRVKI
jgi:hypothetical protein